MSSMRINKPVDVNILFVVHCSPTSNRTIMWPGVADARGSHPGGTVVVSLGHTSTDTDAHPASCPISTGEVFHGVRRSGPDVNHPGPHCERVEKD
jgi:hypothetical protein